MMFAEVLIFGLMSTCAVVSAGALPFNFTTVDQRQTGEYNIHINFKDVKILAVLDPKGLEDYDYNYDYSEITIKPSSGKPGNTSSTTQATTASISTTVSPNTEDVVKITPPPPTSTAQSHAENVTVKAPETTPESKPAKPVEPQNTQTGYIQEIPVQVLLAPMPIQSNQHKRIKTGTRNSANIQQRSSCAEGFYRDVYGNCQHRTKKAPQQSLLRRLIQFTRRAHDS